MLFTDLPRSRAPSDVPSCDWLTPSVTVAGDWIQDTSTRQVALSRPKEHVPYSNIPSAYLEKIRDTVRLGNKRLAHPARLPDAPDLRGRVHGDGVAPPPPLA
ncbi:unnamed protein product, partial [Ectocarpus sp. 12 AP-2014]